MYIDAEEIPAVSRDTLAAAASNDRRRVPIRKITPRLRAHEYIRTRVVYYVCTNANYRLPCNGRNGKDEEEVTAGDGGDGGGGDGHGGGRGRGHGGGNKITTTTN